MITDVKLTLADGQVVNSSGAVLSTNIWDTSAGVAQTAMTGGIAEGAQLLKNFDEGEPLYVIVRHSGASNFTGATSLKIEVLQSAATDMGTPDILASTDALTAAEFPAGGTVAMRLENPSDNMEPKRYVAVRYTPAGGTSANLTIDAFIVHGNQAGPSKLYPTSILTD